MQKQGEKKEEIIEKNSESIKNNEIKKDTVELQKEEYEKKNNKKKKTIKIAIIIGILLFILLLFSIVFSLLNIGNDKIISGVSINGIEMSGLSRNEAKSKLETIISQKNEKEIALKYNDFETAISPELIEVNYNIDSIIEKAFNIGRSSNIFANNYEILFTILGKKNIDIEATLNEEQLSKILDDNSSKLPEAIKESSYYIEEDNLIITKGKKGITINKQETENKIKSVINDINNEETLIEISVIEQEPKPIDINAIYNEVHTEAKDAYYEKEPFQIYPEVNGIDFNVEEAKALLNEDKEEYTIKLIITKPKVTIDQIGTEAFPDRLAHFTTKYNAGDTNRTTNLRLACQKINGKVLLSGETFSYNKTVGERTIAAGYKDAKIYSAGQVVDGIGGGICQISSTLYNAVLEANLEIVERANHQFVTSYLPAGRDATVVYGAIDFQFKNTRKYPIKINASVQNGIATIDIYGIKEQEEYQITLDTRTIATIPFSTKYEDDASLAPGEEVVKQNGANGLQVETYISKSLNGKVVSRTLLAKDTYTPMQKIIRKSTKTAENIETPKTTEQPTQPKKEEKQNTNTTSTKKENTVTKNETTSTNVVKKETTNTTKVKPAEKAENTVKTNTTKDSDKTKN